jgi:hypothetical protein
MDCDCGSGGSERIHVKKPQKLHQNLRRFDWSGCVICTAEHKINDHPQHHHNQDKVQTNKL